MASNNFAYTNFTRNISSVDDLLQLNKLIVKDYPLLTEQSDELLRAAICIDG
jgi:hypothetical protein